METESGCRCWTDTYALGHEGHCCFVREDGNRKIDNGFRQVEDICHAPSRPSLDSGLSDEEVAEVVANARDAEVPAAAPARRVRKPPTKKAS